LPVHADTRNASVSGMHQKIRVINSSSHFMRPLLTVLQRGPCRLLPVQSGARCEAGWNDLRP
jgi:hypothetical protein